MIDEFIKKLKSFHKLDEEQCEWLLRVTHAAMSDVQASRNTEWELSIDTALNIEITMNHGVKRPPGSYPHSILEMLKEADKIEK